MIKNLSTKLLIAFAILSFNTFQIKAQVPGEYRSIGTGMWAMPGIWEMYNGNTWVPAIDKPTYNSAKITIRSPHSVIVNSNDTIDETIVESGADFSVNAGSILTINNGPGNDLILNAGSYGMSGNLVVFPGATITGTGSLSYGAPSLHK
ncbi:MAG: hypothetical protein IPK10_11315 [Bacteroidetes bacterium]|nr:hypothetical protein [Bacteroidota bacterium]